MLDPLVRIIEVPCNQETAFDTFLNGMGRWWPLDKFATSVMAGHAVKELRIDTQVGGKIVEVSTAGDEYLWGTINAYDPYDYISMDFHVPHPTETVDGFTLVEVRFTALDDARTRVELTQSNWENLGDHASMVINGYGKAWGMILEGGYRAACSA